ncbi:DMT family transporter [Haloarchaeobius sp. TZWSO28]|uniref:DMT family transporter n=1 Tax=Haloarchaeobius sp. TZWSO28 TaxID=3446119 RepID=UPI003EB9EAA0
MNDETTGALLVIVSAVGFGTLGIFGKLADAAGLTVPTLLASRFVIASLLVWAVLGLRGNARLLTGRGLAVALGLGTLGYALMSGLYFVGLGYLTAGLAGIVLYTYPAFVVCLALLSGRETITPRLVAALFLCLAGVALVLGVDPAGADPLGVSIVLAAAVVYAGYITASGMALDTVRPRTLTAHVLPAAAGAFIAVGSLTGTLSVPSSPSQWSVVVGIALVATIVPIFAFFAGIQRVGASRASVLSTVEPAVTVVLGAMYLSEPVTATTVVGGVLVLAGVVLAQS